MKTPFLSFCAISLCLSTVGALADAAPDSVTTALSAIDSAKAVAKAGRGTLLMLGSLLSGEEHADDKVVAVLDYPTLQDMKSGMVLILARVGCEPIDECLIARRVTDMDSEHGLQTEPFNGAEGLLLTQVKATLLGSVAYTVDLGTGTIRDLHDARAPQRTLGEAVAEEQARTRVDDPASSGAQSPASNAP
jgi:hypothetical protein